MEFLFQALGWAALSSTALKFKACPKPYHGVEKWEFETGLEGDSKRRPPGEGVETGPLKGDFSSSKGALASCTIPGREVLEGRCDVPTFGSWLSLFGTLKEQRGLARWLSE